MPTRYPVSSANLIGGPLHPMLVTPPIVFWVATWIRRYDLSDDRLEGMVTKCKRVFRWCASLLTILPGIVIAARVRPLWMGWAFVALTAGALTWIVVASVAQDYALLAQNIAITVINCLGIYRWLIWKGNA